MKNKPPFFRQSLLACLLSVLCLMLCGRGTAAWAATITPAITDATIAKSGQFVTFGAYQRVSGGGSRIDFTVTGATDGSLVGQYQATGAVQITVDGTTTTPSYTANVDVALPLFTGSAEATVHTITIIGGSSVVFLKNLSFTGSGTPTLALPANFGGTQYKFNAAPWTTYGSIDGVISTATYGSGAASNLIGGGVIRFASNAPWISLWATATNAGSTSWSIYQDGTFLATVSTTLAFPGYDRILLASGLDTTAVHEYRIVQGVRPGNSFSYIFYVEMGGAGLSSVAHAALDIEAFYGDSITNNLGVSDARDGDAYKLATSLGRVSLPLGNTGTTVTTYLRDNTSQIPTAAKRVWLRGGRNDAAGGVTIGAVGSAGTFTGDYYTMIANTRSRIGAGKWIICQQIIPQATPSAGVRTTYNTAIATAVAAYISNTGDAFIRLVNTDSWLDPTSGVDTTDGIHPNISGYTKMFTRELALFSASLFRRSFGGSRAGSRSSN